MLTARTCDTQALADRRLTPSLTTPVHRRPLPVHLRPSTGAVRSASPALVGTAVAFPPLHDYMTRLESLRSVALRGAVMFGRNSPVWLQAAGGKALALHSHPRRDGCSLGGACRVAILTEGRHAEQPNADWIETTPSAALACGRELAGPRFEILETGRRGRYRFWRGFFSSAAAHDEVLISRDGLKSTFGSPPVKLAHPERTPLLPQQHPSHATYECLTLTLVAPDESHRLELWQLPLNTASTMRCRHCFSKTDEKERRGTGIRIPAKEQSSPGCYTQQRRVRGAGHSDRREPDS